MSILTYLILSVIVMAVPYCIFQIRQYLGRKGSKVRLRDIALLGVNPRGNRKVVYETVTLRRQRLAWLTAINRKSVENGIKDYGNLFSVDNSTGHINTFGFRNSIEKEGTVTRVIAKIRRNFSFRTTNHQRIREVSARTNVAIRSLSKIIPYNLRSLIKPKTTSKGESEEDANNI